MKSDNSYIDSLDRIKDKLHGNIKKKQYNDDLIPCCEEFTFIRWLDQIDFDSEMNELGITHLVLDEKYDLGKVLEHDLINPTRYEINTVLGFIGYTGSGKSWAVLKTIETIFNAYWKIKKKKIKAHICSNYNEFTKAVIESDVDDIIWCDELPLTTGKGSRVQKTQLENILHEIRQRRNTFLLVDPTRIKVDVCYMYLKSAGINFNTNISRFMLLNQKRKYFGHVYFYRPEVITEEYKKKKAEQQIQIIDLRGNVSAEFIDVELEDEEIEEEVYSSYVSNDPINTKRDIIIHKHVKKTKSLNPSKPYTDIFEMLAIIYNLSESSINKIYYNVNTHVKKIENGTIII